MRLPRPRGLPRRIPAWAWRWLKWRNSGNSPAPPKPPAPPAPPAPLQPVTMYDDVNLALIPKTAQAVAGYVGGRWVTFPGLVKAWPNAHHLSIAISAAENADCLDVERGDATPAQAAGWFQRQKANGATLPCFYTSISQAQGLVNTLKTAGIPRSAYRLWTAHYTFQQHFCGPRCGFGFTGRADATQWTDKALGKSLDESICSPGFFS